MIESITDITSPLCSKIRQIEILRGEPCPHKGQTRIIGH